MSASIEGLARAGERLDGELVIDCHCHMGQWHNFIVRDGGPEGMLQTMDLCGIDVACVSHHSAIGPDTPGGNDLVAEASERWPRRFIAYCTLNGHGGEAAVQRELEKHIVNGHALGIKLHPSFHRCPLDKPSLGPAFELADARALPILIHTWHGDAMATPAMIERLAGAYPEARFILGHTGGNAEGAAEYLPVVRAHENVLCDLCGSLMELGIIERLVDKAGDERVLFGSDLPFIDCRPMLGYIAFARIGDESKRRILGLNAARLFGIERALGL